MSGDSLEDRERRLEADNQALSAWKASGEANGRPMTVRKKELSLLTETRDLVVEGGGRHITSEAQRDYIIAKLDSEIAATQEAIEINRSRGLVD